MAFNINDFRARMTGDGARQNLFEVNLNAPAWVGFKSDELPFKCKASSLPASTLGTKEVHYFGHPISFPGDRSYADWTITIYNDENFALRNSFEVWLDGMDKHSQAGAVGSTRGAAGLTNYASEAVVKQYGKEGNVIKTYKFVNIFPTEINAISVDWDDTNNIEQFDVTFKYDYYHAITGGGTQITT